MMQRLERAGAAVGNALRILPSCGEPGYASPGQIAAGLALIFHTRLGPMERLTLASAAWLALEPEDLATLLTAAQRDREPPWPVTGRRHRSPPLTPIEKRRAAAIQFEDSPRAALAAAWAGASDRDRRDLVNRATGRVSA